jgi:YVTN family beta-propeller protein
MIVIACAGIADAASADDSSGSYEPRTAPTFVNWETPQVSPIDKTPDGTKLLVCNTAAGLLEVFDLTGTIPALVAEIPVGVDPVSVRARTNNEVWVVNHVSDSISIVNITNRNVSRTLRTLDEPCDVVFAGTAGRAFVSCSQVNTIQVFDPANPSAAVAAIAIDGEDPRALAVSPDGSTVYAAVFESGNKSTILGGGITGNGTISFPPNVVSNAAGPYRGVNPPPNSGTTFSPAKSSTNGNAPRVGQIVRKNTATNQWLDGNGRNWTNFITWDQHDNDVAVINTSTNAVTYVKGLMTTVCSIGATAGGDVVAIGMESRNNELHFEQNVDGVFVKCLAARLTGGAGPGSVVDINPHLTYTSSTTSVVNRLQSIGDPRGVAFSAAMKGSTA